MPRRRLLVSVCWVLVSVCWALPLAAGPLGQGAAAVEKPPALLEPYAGFDVIFEPTAQRVLGPDAAPAVERMLVKPAKMLGSSQCEIGDISLGGGQIQIALACADGKFSVRLAAKDRPGGDGTAAFAIAWPVEWAAACPEPCATQHAAVKAELTARVLRGETAIPWQRARPVPGVAGGGVLAALQAAHHALAVGDRSGAVAGLASARAAQPPADWAAVQCLDFAVLALELGADATWAVACATLPAGPNSGCDRPLALALAGEVTAAAEQASKRGAEPACDVLPVVRALVARHAYAKAAKLLDRGPLAQAAVPLDLLKLRFGLASAMADAAGELATAQRIAEQMPDSPQAVDLMAAGLARSGQYRKAIEILHDLSKKHPERDIVLGRIAGLLNFLTDAAGADPARKADLDAVEARMRAAAADEGDLVAQFVVATRAYYGGRLQEALPQLEALNQRGSRDPRLPLYLAMAHFWLGHQEPAQKIIQHAVEIGPSDPDVFYCRSQIVRSVNLPLAIADLERYEAMTTQPWSIGPALKAQRVAAELKFMRQGLLPPDWDRPGPLRAAFLPDSQTGTQVGPDVRSGAHWLPGAPTPADAAAPATATQAPAEPATITAAPPPAPSHPSHSGEESPWWPLATAVAAIAALAARYFSNRPSNKP